MNIIVNEFRQKKNKQCFIIIVVIFVGTLKSPQSQRALKSLSIQNLRIIIVSPALQWHAIVCTSK